MFSVSTNFLKCFTDAWIFLIIFSNGSFAYTQEPKGCQKCNCNGHGDPRLGYCNSTTGACFCLNNTMGTNCEKCIEGYYGNPQYVILCTSFYLKILKISL